MDTTTGYTSQAVYETLRQEILNLHIKPGQQLNESEVCRRFQVSRTPVRTAFQRLKDAGLLHIVPYKGTSATLLDFNNIEQMIYMRVALETKVITDLIQTQTPLLLEEIHHTLRHQAILLDSGDVADGFYALDSKLHGIWFKHTQKDLLWNMIQDAQIHYTRFRMLDIVEVKDFQEIYKEHLELFDIIRHKRAGQVEPLIHRHLYGGVRRLRHLIDGPLKDFFVPQEPSPFWRLPLE